MPGVVAEGRRVIANVERVANLFVTKTVYAMLLAIAVGVTRWPYPFLPRHLTIISSLTIGIPAFFLALGPSSRRYVPGFVRRVLRFAGRAGLVAAVATFAVYAVAHETDGVSLDEARTAATMALLARRALDPRHAGAAVHAAARWCSSPRWPAASSARSRSPACGTSSRSKCRRPECCGAVAIVAVAAAVVLETGLRLAGRGRDAANVA